MASRRILSDGALANCPLDCSAWLNLSRGSMVVK
ncbi:unnamed protein product [Mesocestoides corti]|uniref:Uncharacterized protein n=1 Tax=Mesocestoides corti TaxID=53468 RepID=A0A3P6HJ28_MESCO|nr:unnamed protein product [Mesocestoides corti]